MEAALMNPFSFTNLPPQQVLESFFTSNNQESVREKAWYLFKCWVTNSCGEKEKLPDEEIALFLDQLIDLVAAAYTLHQANRVSANPQEGKGND